MPDKVPNSSLNEATIAKATITVTVVGIFIAVFSIDDSDLAFTVASILAFLTLLIGSYLIFGDRIKQAAVSQNLKTRWSGPDLQKHPCWHRFLVLLMGITYRFVARLPILPHFWVSIAGVSMGIVVYTVFFVLHCIRDPDVSRLLCDDRAVGLAVIVGPFLITWAAFMFSLHVHYVVRKSDPTRKTIRDFIIALENYMADFWGSSPAQIRREIAANDRGPVLIVSVSARDLLSSAGTLENQVGYDVFAEAWKNDRDKCFTVLLSDPVSDAVVSRDKRLNGRYLEYYAIPYLRILFKWYEEERAGSGRILLHRWVHEPDFRIVMSKDRMVMQRYGKFQHGFHHVPIILHRVHFSSVLDDGFSSYRCWESQGQRCALVAAGFWDKHSGSLRLEKRSIFAHFSNTFQKLVENSEKETFLNTWELDRLKKFAKLCGLRRGVTAQYNTCSKLAEAICAHVDLQDEFRRLNNA